MVRGRGGSGALRIVTCVALGGGPSRGGGPASAAPSVSFAATLSTLDIHGTTVPLAGATIGFSTCPGFVITTDATGAASTQLTEGIALSPLYSGGPTVIAAV